MQRSPGRWSAALVLGLMLVGVRSGVARADLVATVSVAVTQQTPGVFLYSYTLANLASSTSTIGEFDIALTTNPSSGIITPLGAVITPVGMPTGFVNTYTSGDPFIVYQSTDASFDIAAGTSAQFSFTSTAAAHIVPFLLASYDGSGNTLQGSILAPSTVPEPSTLALAGLGLVGFAGWRLRGRRRASTPA